MKVYEENGIEINEREDTIGVEFMYPRSNKIKYLTVGLCDVRANDGMRIWFDFDRDGFVIEQPQQLSWNVDEKVDYKWKEVAFIQGWFFEKEQQENESK